MATISRTPGVGSTTLTLSKLPEQPQEVSLQFELHAPLEPYQDAIDTANRLVDILERHREELENPNGLDRISYKLSLRAEKFINYVLDPENGELSREDLIAQVAKLKKLLCLGGHFPKNLFKAGKFALEEDALKLFCLAYNKVAEAEISFGEIAPIVAEQEGVPHVFAHDVIQWIRDLEGPGDSQAPQPEFSGITATRDEMGFPVLQGLQGRIKKEPIIAFTGSIPAFLTMETACLIYEKFDRARQKEMTQRAKKAEKLVRQVEQEKQTREMDQMTEIFKERSRILQDNLEKREIRSRQDLNQLRVDVQQHTGILADSLHRTQTEQATILTLHANTRKVLQQTQVDLSTQTQRLQWSQKTIHELNVKVQNVEASNWALCVKVGQLQQKVADADGGGCTIS